MKIDPVFLLVALAFALMVFLPIFDRDRTLSPSLKSSRRRRVLFGRLAVIVLLLAALVTLIWRIEGMHSLVQGVLLSALVLVPAYVAHLLASLFYRSSDKEEDTVSDAELESKYQHGVRPDADQLDYNRKHNKNADDSEATENQPSVNAPIDFGIDTIPVIHLPLDAGLPDNFDFADISSDVEENSDRAQRKNQRRHLQNIRTDCTNRIRDYFLNRCRA